MLDRKSILTESRRKKGLTQKQLADMLGITLRSYQRYEYGERNFRVDKTLQLAEILEISVYDLAGHNSNAKPYKTEIA